MFRKQQGARTKVPVAADVRRRHLALTIARFKASLFALRSYAEADFAASMNALTLA